MFSTPEFVAGQLLVVGPWLVWCLIKSLGERELATRALWWLATPMLAFWLLCSMLTRVEANWTALVWPPLLLCLLDSPKERWFNAFRVNVVLSGLVVIVALGFSRLAPLHEGPPRDGVALAKCIDGAGDGQAYTVRYQEQALLESAGVTSDYGDLRPAGVHSMITGGTLRIQSVAVCLLVRRNTLGWHARMGFEAKAAVLVWSPCACADQAIKKSPTEVELFSAKGGVEPPRPKRHRNLNPARLPIPPLSRDGSYRAVLHLSQG